MSKRYYEDLSVGEIRELAEREISEREMLDFAQQYDPQYFHADPDAAKSSIFGGVIASGIQNLAIWRQLDHEITGDIAWICGVGWDDVRMKTAVHPGDSLRARAECLKKRLSAKDPRRGVVVYRYSLLNQKDEIVLTFLSTNLVERRRERAAQED